MTIHEHDTVQQSVGDDMQAVGRTAYGDPAAVLQPMRLPVPAIGPDDVLVRVRAAGVDRGVWHLTTGLPYPLRLAGFGVRAPKAPVVGRDLAGVVAAVGPAVNRFHVGDEVYGTADGTFAQYARAQQDRLSPKPASLTFEQAAAVPVSGMTALQAVRDHGRVTAGQQVLVVGASGGVGSYAVQIAVAHGASVTGVASGAKADVVRSLGADTVLDHRVDRPADHRYDVVLDIGGNTPVSRLRRALTSSGTLVIVGGEGGGRVLGGLQRQLGATLLSPFVRQRLGTFVCSENAADLAVLTGLVEAGQVLPTVDRVLPLASAATALQLLVDGAVRGKLVLSTEPVA